MTTKFSGFTNGSAIQAADNIVGLQGGANVKWTGTQLQTFIGVSVAAGKTLSARNTLTLAGTDGSTLNIVAGGTLGSNAFTSAASAAAYAAARK
jgi:hypothetical protein